MKLSDVGYWLVVGLVILGAFLVFMAKAARAHDAPSGWSYPVDCCSGHDCDLIAASRVQSIGGGYLIDGAHYVPAGQVRRSPDGEFHACFPTKDKLRCFWAPPPST